MTTFPQLTQRVMVPLVLGLLLHSTESQAQRAMQSLGAMSGALEGYAQGLRDAEERQRKIDSINAEVRSINQSLKLDKELMEQLEQIRNDTSIRRAELLISRSENSVAERYIKPLLVECQSLREKNKKPNFQMEWHEALREFEEKVEAKKRQFENLRDDIHASQSTRYRGSSFRDTLFEMHKSLSLSSLSLFAIELSKIETQNKHDIVMMYLCLASLNSSYVPFRWGSTLRVAADHFLNYEMKNDFDSIKESLRIIVTH